MALLPRRAARAFATASSRPPRVAVVGSGPGGFYTAKYLLRAVPDLRVTVIDRWPAPFGLVRFGVAPDHPEVKAVGDDFESVARDHADRFSFAGDVFVGHPTDALRADHDGPVVGLPALRQAFDAVVVACGAAGARELGLPGEDLEGVVAARDFVGWYNAEPSHAFLEPLAGLAGRDRLNAAVVGQGNVALDCARVLAAPPSLIEPTDMTRRAVAALGELPQKRRVDVLGRRGATQAAFTLKECRELANLDGGALVVDEAELLAGDTAASLEEGTTRPLTRRRKFLDDVVKKSASAEREVRLRFLKTPVEFRPAADDASRVGSVVVENCVLEGPAGSQRAVGTGEFEELPCDLAITAVGYVSAPPDPRGGRAAERDGPSGGYASTKGRVDGEDFLYCAGWVKRGPTGIVGSNVADARETANAVVADLATRAETPAAFSGDAVDWAGWRAIDEVERAAGEMYDAPRAKLDDVGAMREVARRWGGGGVV
mmetsp:Transcript_910/g.2708  ORF Transcript_910/g.2708 Transcript_910/m.2708 type:complete len:487 (+) Transcript_910:204-1664(+)